MKRMLGVVAVVSAVFYPTLCSAVAITIASAGVARSDVRHNVANTGTGSACAFSSTPSLGANQTVTHVPAPTPRPAPTCNFKDDRGIARGGVGDLNITKAPPNNDTWESVTNGGATEGRGEGQFTFFPLDGTVTLRVLGRAIIGTGPADDPSAVGAGYADDPMLFQPGNFDYSIVLDELDLEMLDLSPGDTGDAGIEFSAETSIPGAESLWSLKLALDESLVLSAAFTSAPILGLDDALVLSGLLAALDSPQPGRFVLPDPFLLFATSFTVDQEFEFGEFARSHAAGQVAGEPSALVLVLAGLGLLTRKRVRSRQLPSARPTPEEGSEPID